MTAETISENGATPDLERVTRDLAAARAAIGQRIYGQEQVIELALTTILSGGHGLLVGVPGVAKTRLVATLGAVLGLQTKRVQFTPDLMPSDIIGSEVLEESEDGRRSFRFIRGPVFTQLLMADEINRASPRTQSALLQAMQERQVTVASTTHDLPWPFQVLAAGDFFVEPAAFEKMVALFAASGARGHLIQIVDPAEEEFPYEGRVRFEGVEGLDASLVGRAQSLRTVYRTRFEAHREELHRIAARYGWSFMAHRTDRPAESAVLGLSRRLSDDRRGRVRA